MSQIDLKKLPLAIRNNNAAGLLQAFGPSSLNKIVDGLAAFNTMQEGVEAIYYGIDSHYNKLGHRTLRDFIAQFPIPATADIMATEKALCARLRLDPKTATTYDLKLDRAWNAVDMARGLIALQSATPPPQWRGWPEWIAVSEHSTAILRTGRWSDA